MQIEREFLHRHGEHALSRLQDLGIRQDAYFSGSDRRDLSPRDKRELRKLQDKWLDIESGFMPTCPPGF